MTTAPAKLFSLTALAVVLAAPCGALAGGTAEIETGSGSDRLRTTIEFDGAKVRMLTALPQGEDAPQGEMILRDGKVYAVIDRGSNPTVMEMSGMMKMIGGAMQQAPSPDAFDEVARYHGLSATGRAETVGGLRGEVFRLDYETKAGTRESTEVVLATQAVAREMSLSMAAVGSTMAESMGVIEPEGSRQLQAELERRKVGVLRFGDEYRVLSLNSSTPPASRFVLPAAPMQMPALPGLQGGAGVQGSAGVGVGGLLGEKIERQKDRIEARSEGETDAATDRAVDKVLDKAFGKIFGGQ